MAAARFGSVGGGEVPRACVDYRNLDREVGIL
jgi:hypothetical protein